MVASKGPYWDPFFVHVYVNYMSGVVNNKFHLYADDSAILVADKQKSNIEKLLKKELEKVGD